MTDEVRPDLYRLTSPMRMHPFGAALVGLALAVVCYLAAGVVTGRAASQARLDVAPALDPAMVELAAVVPGSGLTTLGRLNVAPDLTVLLSYLTQRNAQEAFGLDESVDMTVVRDPLGTRASVVITGPDEAAVTGALESVQQGLTAQLQTLTRSDLEAARRGVATQLETIDAQLAELGDLDPDLVVRAALTNQRVALVAVDDVLADFPPDAVGVEYTITEEASAARPSSVARVALAAVLWMLAVAATLGLFALVSDKVRSFPDVVRYSDGARIAGLVGDREADGIAAVAHGLTRASGARAVHLHATAASVDDLAARLRSEPMDRDNGFDVVAFAREDRAGGLRAVDADVVDLVVVDWAKTSRTDLLDSVTQLRLAGAPDVGVIVRGLPGRAQSVVA